MQWSLCRSVETSWVGVAAPRPLGDFAVKVYFQA